MGPGALEWQGSLTPIHTTRSKISTQIYRQVDDPLVLTNPGAKDGETRVVREPDGSVWAYGWNAGKREWDRIGEVVAAPEAGACLESYRGSLCVCGWADVCVRCTLRLSSLHRNTSLTTLVQARSAAAPRPMQAAPGTLFLTWSWILAPS